MTEKKFEIQLVSPEVKQNSEQFLATLNEQVKNAKESDAGIALQDLVSDMTPLPENVEDVTKEELEQIKTDKNVLVKARTAIAKNAKYARDFQTGINTAIKAYETSILEIAGEEENKRKDFIKNVEKYNLEQERKKTLEEYKDKFEGVSDTVVWQIMVEYYDSQHVIGNDVCGITSGEMDKFLLKFDTTERITFYNQIIAEKNIQDNLAMQEKAIADIKAKEEEEVAKIEAKAKAEREKEQLAKKEREKQLPTRKGKLASIGFDKYTIDIVLNNMDNNTFNAYYNECVAGKNKADQIAIEEANNKKAKEDAEAKAKIEAEKAEEEIKKKALESAEADRIEKERLEKEELAANKKYQNWLNNNNYNPEKGDIILDNKMYNLKSIYEKE